MKTALAIFATFALGAPSVPAQSLDSLLGPGSPSCVLMATIERAGANVAPLSTDQFNFARGAYVATPPMSATLPPGNRAALIEKDGAAYAAIVTGEGRAAETCARVLSQNAFGHCGGRNPASGERAIAQR
jgi:hypothetical protein